MQQISASLENSMNSLLLKRKSGGGDESRKVIRYPRLESNYPLENANLDPDRVPERINEDWISFYEESSDGFINYLKHLSRIHKIDLRSNIEEYKDKYFELIQLPDVYQLRQAEESEQIKEIKQKQAQRNSIIFKDEVDLIEKDFRDLNILPEFCGVDGISISARRYEEGAISEFTLDMNLTLNLNPQYFPILATRHNELTPSTAIGRQFRLELEITISGEEIIILPKISDPEVPEMPLWHNFTNEEMNDLAAERSKLLELVDDYNRQQINGSLKESQKVAILDMIRRITDSVNSRMEV